MVEKTATTTKQTESRQKSRQRISELAKPKRLSSGHIPDRRSVYWVDKEPAMRPNHREKVPKRLKDLSKPRKTPFGYIEDRSTAVSQVSEGARNCDPENPYLNKLAQPKALHRDYEASNYAFNQVEPNAMKHEARKRTEHLAKPKSRLTFEQAEDRALDEMNKRQWTFYRDELTSGGSRNEDGDAPDEGRIEKLAVPKRSHNGAGQNRSPLWGVAPGALTAEPSQRLDALSKPRVRSELDHDYDPYIVSPASKNHVASSRLNELCQPVPYKVTPKKQLNINK